MDRSISPLVLVTGMTAGAAARAMLLRNAALLSEGLAQTLLEDDPEGPHRARVALRRLRSALWALRPVLRRRKTRRLDRRCRALFRMLGPLRDADVLALAHAASPDGMALADTAAGLRAEARLEICAGGALALPGWIAAFAMTGAHRRRPGARPASDLARDRLDVAWQACQAHGPDLLAMSDTDLHELRKSIKRLRYVVEFMEPIWADAATANWVQGLRRLQDGLGAVCDDLLAVERGLQPEPLAAGARRHSAAALWADAVGRVPFWTGPTDEAWED